MNPFKQDIIDLFRRKRGGHVDHWLYSDTLRKDMTGSQLWHAFLRASKNYYILPNEIQLLAGLSEKIGHSMKDIDTVVDFGVGDEMAVVNKAIPVIKGIPNVKVYIGIDISKDFLNAACQRVSNELHIKSIPLEADFYNLKSPLEGTQRLGLMFGSTITNQDMREGHDFPRDKIVSKLKRLKEAVGQNGRMLVTYDANPDPEGAMNAYDNVFWSRHVTGIMYDIQRLTKGRFSASGWVHKRIWGKEVPVVHQCAEATEHHEFSINGHHFSIKKGERFVTVNNFKYPVPLFQSMCEEAGFKIGKSYADHQSRMHIQDLAV